jgi:intracellular sulfur oxidation DsrE/DsrF family protein
MFKLISKNALSLLAILSLGLVSAANAAEIKTDKAFADKKIVLQISDSDPFKQTLVLNVASNLIKAYGTDKVDIEIVSFGPGLRLLFAENGNKGRIQGLASEGVRFAACKNTMRNMGKKLGHAPALNSNAVQVDAGVVRIVDLTDAGYTLIKP